MIETETCSLCGEKKVLLAVPTERQSLAVFVCAKKVGKAKMPCDGFAALIAQQDDGA